MCCLLVSMAASHHSHYLSSVSRQSKPPFQSCNETGVPSNISKPVGMCIRHSCQFQTRRQLPMNRCVAFQISISVSERVYQPPQCTHCSQSQTMRGHKPRMKYSSLLRRAGLQTTHRSSLESKMSYFLGQSTKVLLRVTLHWRHHCTAKPIHHSSVQLESDLSF